MLLDRCLCLQTAAWCGTRSLYRVRRARVVANVRPGGAVLPLPRGRQNSGDTLCARERSAAFAHSACLRRETTRRSRLNAAVVQQCAYGPTGQCRMQTPRSWTAAGTRAASPTGFCGATHAVPLRRSERAGLLIPAVGTPPKRRRLGGSIVFVLVGILSTAPRCRVAPYMSRLPLESARLWRWQQQQQH